MSAEASKSLMEDIAQIAILTTIAFFIPFWIHMVPSSFQHTWGTYLIPIFYAPFLALLFADIKVSLLCAVLGIYFNHIFTGHPSLGMIRQLLPQLMIFAVASGIFLDLKAIKVVAAPLAYILAVFILASFKLISLDILLVTWPGILVLALMNFLVLKISGK